MEDPTVGDDPIIRIDIPVRQIEANQNTAIVRTGNWTCTVSQPILEEDGLENDLEVVVALQRPGPAHPPPRLSQYSHLTVMSTMADGQDECLQEATIREPEMLVQGVKVYIEPGFVFYRQRYVFHIQLHTRKNNNQARRQQHQPRHHPYHRNVQPTTASISPPIDALRSSEVFIAAKYRLKEFLERPRGTDIQITFNQLKTPSPTPSSPSSESSAPCSPTESTHARITPDHNTLQDDGRDSATLLVHSCILSTVSSPAMRSLLNTYPPSPPSPLPSTSTAPSLAAMQTPLQLLPGSTLFSFNRRHAPPPSPSARPEPIREIRFEDSPPEAVRAVVRYIYLGQKPILEPYCGYTVKDLMALASYFEIPPLEDYCVQLVLGTHRDSTFADDDDHDIHYNANVINNNHMVLLQTNQPKSRISPEMAVQVLFDWGYKYTKIRSALVCALIESGSSAADEDVLYDPEVGLMRAFEDHRAFSAVLCEMTERRLSRRLV